MNCHNTWRYVVFVSFFYLGCKTSQPKTQIKTIPQKTVESHTLSKEIDTLIKLTLNYDKREDWWNIDIDTSENSKIKLSIETINPTIADSVKSLVAKYSNVDSKIELLPNPSRLDSLVWGRVLVSVANMRATPSESAELVSQVVIGTPIKIIKKNDKGWFFIQSPDKYVGWIEEADFIKMDKNKFQSWRKAPKFLINKNNITVESEDGNIQGLVYGGVFEIVAEKNNEYILKTPSAKKVMVNKNDGIKIDELDENLNFDEMLAYAKTLENRPYLWGGTSARAIDCSGYMKMIYLKKGFIIPRDASLQARGGEEVSKENLQKGDFLFWGRYKDGKPKITHVGIYLGGEKFIHSSGRVRISSLNPKSKIYEPNRTLITIKRYNRVDLGNHLVLIANHPWYK